jgi:hypothetical protein
MKTSTSTGPVAGSAWLSRPSNFAISLSIVLPAPGRRVGASFGAMNVKFIRLALALAATLVALSVSAVAVDASNTGYCDPLSSCNSHFLKVSPGIVKAGNATTVSGAVGNGCKKPAQVTVYSRAFKGATRREFAGVPAFFIKTTKRGKFTKKVTLKRTVKPGRYHVGGRCGGGNFGAATLKVTK